MNSESPNLKSRNSLTNFTGESLRSTSIPSMFFVFSTFFYLPSESHKPGSEAGCGWSSPSDTEAVEPYTICRIFLKVNDRKKARTIIQISRSLASGTLKFLKS